MKPKIKQFLILTVTIMIKTLTLSPLSFKQQRYQTHSVFKVTTHCFHCIVPVGLFYLFMTEDTKRIVDVGAALGETFIIRVSQKEHYISSSQIRIAVKGKKIYNCREEPPIKEEAKHIWSWLISNRMQNGLYFEANQNSCGGQGLPHAAHWCSVIMAHACDTQRP